jgi:hypothetical protein
MKRMDKERNIKKNLRKGEERRRKQSEKRKRGREKL